VTLYVLSVWLHVAAAAVWVGSMVFFAAVVIPVVRRPEYQGAFADLIRKVGARYRALGWICIAILVVTGITNIFLHGFPFEYVMSGAFWSSAYGATLLHKLVFVALVIFATAMHDTLMGKKAVEAMRANPNSPAALRSRKIASWLGRATLLLSLCILVLAVALARGVPW
jgi:uncharacterized membrane protein